MGIFYNVKIFNIKMTVILTPERKESIKRIQFSDILMKQFKTMSKEDIQTCNTSQQENLDSSI